MQSCIQIPLSPWLWAPGGKRPPDLGPGGQTGARRGRREGLGLAWTARSTRENPMSQKDPRKPTHEEEEELLEEQGEESFPSSDPPATEGSPHI